MTQVIADRQLVSVETIERIDEIPGADMIVAAKIKGWTVVVKRGEFQVGDSCVYFEIDSMLPVDDDRFAFLAQRGTKEVDGKKYHKLSTARLRGVYSQGLALPVDGFDTSDLDSLGIFKYEPPALTGKGDLIATYPDHLASRTRAERVQNVASTWDEVLASGPWIGSEKVDGTSMSVFRTDDGELLVCGHNYQIREGDNIYWRAVEKYNLGDTLAPGMGLQCELYGPGIQGNSLGVKEQQVAVFAVIIDHSPIARADWPSELLALASPVYELELPATAALALAQVDGIKSLIAPERNAEGIVWHNTTGDTIKAISNKYLVKHDG
ncbi:MAG: RNA ligase (ATP) [Ferrimicrobium acidiphilum]